MKRRREAEISSEIRSAIQELSAASERDVVKPTAERDSVKPAAETEGVKPAAERCGDDLQTTLQIPIKPFLSLCNLLIQVLDKIGPTMAVLRQDIHQNIQRLETVHDSDPLRYWDVVEILKKEVSEGKAKKGPTCSKAFVWLTRSLDFSVTLLKLLVEDFERDMEQAVEKSYNNTLKPWHGWISSAAYKVALKLVPDTKSLIDILKAKDADNDMLKKEMQILISLLVPQLERNYETMRTYGLDKLKST
ncbi:glycolipid transfer protein 3-like [Olea europaea var. sylvestris]|uniref:glycolipid transfer protein 3-like n=1 Tax=Olea europaea var. sylvestris TaxID=158386 RepID=UPI000C1D71F4|nr:glycolipid transfer protein 3-like [Olea europaea var. sylvestris]